MFNRLFHPKLLITYLICAATTACSVKLNDREFHREDWIVSHVGVDTGQMSHPSNSPYLDGVYDRRNPVQVCVSNFTSGLSGLLGVEPQRLKNKNRVSSGGVKRIAELETAVAKCLEREGLLGAAYVEFENGQRTLPSEYLTALNETHRRDVATVAIIGAVVVAGAVAAANSAGGNSSQYRNPYRTGDVFVQGYFRQDGTYVQSHYRTRPDGVCWNNYSGC